MFSDARTNLRYVWRSIGKVVKRFDVDRLAEKTGLSITALEELSLYGVDPDWQGLEIDSKLELGDLARLAEACGLGLKVEICDSECLDSWALDTTGEELLPVRQNSVMVSCVICRHPNRMEIELALAGGISLGKLKDMFKFAQTTVVKHRDVCMAGRIDRLQAALGNAADLSALTGTVKVADRVMELGHRAAEQAMAASEFAATDALIKRLLQGTELRGKLTGELTTDREDGGGEGGKPAAPNNTSGVAVFVIPPREQGNDKGPSPHVIDIGRG